LVRDLAVKLHSIRERLVESIEGPGDAEFDDELEVEDELKKHDFVLIELSEVIGALVRAQPEGFLSSLVELAPILLTLSHAKSAPSERQMALTVFDDIIENTKGTMLEFTLTANNTPVVVNFWDHFVPMLFDNVFSEEDSLRQVAAYGLGVCCEYGGPKFLPFVVKAADQLLLMLNAPIPKHFDSLVARDNAISAFGKIIEFHAQIFGPKIFEYSNLWLSWLPLTSDQLESRTSYERLLRLVQKQTPNIIGQNWSNFPQILNIFTQGFDDRESLSQETLSGLVELLKQFPPDVTTNAVAGFPPDLKARFFRFWSENILMAK